ncbi:hypothetical protein L6164_021280 [Bauhinia variegata]|uniref:Uncharacterized protein n=1 Tax=Bauhinia variegata TaxID=167791 RepID=A0ACB9N3B7_BAUVA|nr:hypothetical protein L6164_021280 [Bauhinia variegata]
MLALLLGPARPCNLVIPNTKRATPFASSKLLVSSAYPIRSKLPRDDGVSSQQFRDLGRSLPTVLQSNSGSTDPITEPPEKLKQEGQVAQISGSDVLWALQRATVKKKKQQKRRVPMPSSEDSRRGESGLDYSTVRPLHIKSEWGAKLDDLENRLRELSETI